MATQITIIGSGNMGTSLLNGLIHHGFSANHLCITDTDAEKLNQIQQQFHVNISTNNNEAIKHADVIILAVKPQIMADVANEIAATVQIKKPLIISIAAGIPIASMEKWLGGSTPIVRTMPNTPAMIGCGMTALFANKYVSSEQHQLAESLLSAAGKIIWVDREELMHAVTAISGSGPAYFFLMIEALQDAALKLGLSKEDARILTLQTAYGAARMGLESKDDVATLRQKVTSKGGTTEAALNVLEENNIRTIFLKAVQAADTRSQELATTGK